MDKERAPKLWSCDPAAEKLSATSIKEALIEAYGEDLEKPLPKPIIVYGYAPVDIDDYLDAATIAEMALQQVDEELGDPYGDEAKPTPRMIEAAQGLVDAIKADYTPWMCERVCEWKIGEKLTDEEIERIKRLAEREGWSSIEVNEK